MKAWLCGAMGSTCSALGAVIGFGSPYTRFKESAIYLRAHRTLMTPVNVLVRSVIAQTVDKRKMESQWFGLVKKEELDSRDRKTSQPRLKIRML